MAVCVSFGDCALQHFTQCNFNTVENTNTFHCGTHALRFRQRGVWVDRLRLTEGRPVLPPEQPNSTGASFFCFVTRLQSYITNKILQKCKLKKTSAIIYLLLNRVESRF